MDSNRTHPRHVQRYIKKRERLTRYRDAALFYYYGQVLRRCRDKNLTKYQLYAIAARPFYLSMERARKYIARMVQNPPDLNDYLDEEMINDVLEAHRLYYELFESKHQ